MATGIGRPHLSVVVPAYNEEAGIGETLSRIGAYLRDNELDAEILVVDDGSADGTAKGTALSSVLLGAPLLRWLARWLARSTPLR